jgi:hypothetical protein
MDTIKRMFGIGGQQQRVDEVRNRAQADQDRIFAEQSRVAEESRKKLIELQQKQQADIQTGQSEIDKAFSQFNPAFYKGIQTAHLNTQVPEINRQFQRSSNKLAATQFNKGMLESSAGNQQRADLGLVAGNAQAKAANDAANYSLDAEKTVNASRNKLYDLNLSAADPAGLAARAQGEATTLAQAVPLPGLTQGGDNAIANAFSSFLQPLTYATTAFTNAPGAKRTVNPYELAPLSGPGSSTKLG